MKKLKQKILTTLLILVMLGQSVIPSAVIAEETPAETPPVENSQPETSPVETTTETTTENTTPENTENQNPENTQTTEEVQTVQTTENNVTPTPTERPRRENESSKRRAEDDAREAQEKAERNASKPKTVTNPSSSSTPQASTGSKGANDNGSAPSLETGNATTNGVITNNANSNLATTGSGGKSGATVANKNNGAGSTNSGSATVGNSSTTDQSNEANIDNDMQLGALTGGNSASRNYGGAEIETGDANVSGTIVNSVNTNVDGVAVAEFNVVDDHVGDIVLDFGDISCVVNCGGAGSLTAQNSGNGAESDNTAKIDSNNSSETTQFNQADINNDMVLTAVTGENKANDNIGGDVSINTGDANLSANIVNFANNNIAGNVLFGVVNIFGDLIGDIILPDNPFASCSTCFANDTYVGNTGNGADSTNTSTANISNADNTFQYNDANIENNIIVDANTGGNSMNDNIGGDKDVDTGNVNVEANVLNIANSNIIGGDWWLVIVNEAGNWIGKIMGAPEGSNFAGSYGTEFMVNDNGEVVAVNNGNLEGSDNTANTSSTNTNTTNQTNEANIVNNINLTGNTGDNKANQNGGGDVSVKTGDVNAIANIVNFVNNNIAGDGRLFVTMINVFGTWMGDVVTPGQKKETASNTNNTNTNGQGGQSNNSSSNNNNSSNSSSSNSSVSKTNSASGEVLLSVNEDEEDQDNFGAGYVQGEKTQNGSVKEATVATIVGQDDSAAVAEKTLSLNLAWFLLALPILVIVRLLRKTYVPVKTLALKGIHLFL